MTNFENHKERMLEIVDTKDTGVAVCNGVLHPCGDVSCENCDFCRIGNYDCEVRFIRWLCQEYEEKPKLSERAYHFLKSLPEGARIRECDPHLQIQTEVTEVISYYRENNYIPKLPPLVNEVWYEVSEILKFEKEQ